MSVQLAKLGLLTELDAAALGGYCDAFENVEWARKMVRSQGKYAGRVTTAPSGYRQVSAYWTILKQATELMHKFLSEFGLTPSSRSRLDLSIGAPEKVDPFEEFLEE